MKKLLLVVLFSLATALYSYPSNIKITKSEENYIRSNLTYLFGEDKLCHSIGRAYVNFPEIYDGGRTYMLDSLLKQINKRKYSARESYCLYFTDEMSTNQKVESWYANYCVPEREDAAKKVKALEYFYRHMPEGDC